MCMSIVYYVCMYMYVYILYIYVYVYVYIMYMCMYILYICVLLHNQWVYVGVRGSRHHMLAVA